MTKKKPTPDMIMKLTKILDLTVLIYWTLFADMKCGNRRRCTVKLLPLYFGGCMIIEIERKSHFKERKKKERLFVKLLFKIYIKISKKR